MKKAIREFRRWLHEQNNRNWFVPLLLTVMIGSWVVALQPRPPVESCPLICERCGFSEIRDIAPAQIDQVDCLKCGGSCGFVWKCPDCDYEFPLVLSVILPGSMTPEKELAYRLKE